MDMSSCKRGNLCLPHYNPQGTPERTEKIDEPFSFYINTNIKQLLDEVEHDTVS